MVLRPEDIEVLETLRVPNVNDWFQIKSPNYVWDADNKVRLAVDTAVREFLECSISFFSKLDAKQHSVLVNLASSVGFPLDSGEPFVFN